MTRITDLDETRRTIKERWENSNDTREQIAKAIGTTQSNFNYTLFRCGLRLETVWLAPGDELEVKGE